MITLNILPEKLKKDAELMIVNKFIKKIINLMIYCVLFFCLVLFAANYYLEAHYEQTINQSNTAAKSSENYSNRVKEINNQIASIKKMQDTEIDWTKTIIGISKLVNEGISVKRLNITKANNGIIIAGIAKSRNDLLLFKNNLEKTQNFSEIKLPIKTMLEQSDIEFEIATVIKKYEFD